MTPENMVSGWTLVRVLLARNLLSSLKTESNVDKETIGVPIRRERNPEECMVGHDIFFG